MKQPTIQEENPLNSSVAPDASVPEVAASHTKLWIGIGSAVAVMLLLVALGVYMLRPKTTAMSVTPVMSHSDKRP